MSELIAWGDESVQTQGGVIPTYYMGACICGLGERDIRSQLLSATKRKVSKLHWRGMTLSEKRRSIPVIEAFPRSGGDVSGRPSSASNPMSFVPHRTV